MSEPIRSRLIPRMLIAGVVLIALAVLALVGLFIANHRRPSGPVNVAIRNSLVGTWVGDHGAVLEFRSDGTATSRSTKYLHHRPRGLVWTVSGNELAVFSDDQGKIGRYVFNRPSACAEIVGLTPDQMGLIDRSSGKVLHLRFRKVNDAAPGNAP